MKGQLGGQSQRGSQQEKLASNQGVSGKEQHLWLMMESDGR